MGIKRRKLFKSQLSKASERGYFVRAGCKLSSIFRNQLLLGRKESGARKKYLLVDITQYISKFSWSFDMDKKRTKILSLALNKPKKLY